VCREGHPCCWPGSGLSSRAGGIGRIIAALRRPARGNPRDRLPEAAILTGEGFEHEGYQRFHDDRLAIDSSSGFS
jgi:hypothetical protein